MKRKGFTLIELIIVLIIIGILASIAGPMMGGMKNKAMISEAQTALGSIRTVLRQYYYVLNQQYPVFGAGTYIVDLTPSQLAEIGMSQSDVDSLTGTYFGKECYVVGLLPVARIAAGCVINNGNWVNTSAPKSTDTQGLMDTGSGYCQIFIGYTGRFEYYRIKGKGAVE